MDKAQSDLGEWYKLDTKFFRDGVRHTRYVGKTKNGRKKVKEDWRNCGKLGTGGFGDVDKQIQEATGHYRAVKTIKRQVCKFDYSREFLVMAKLAKVCALTPEEFCPKAQFLRDLSCCVLMGSFFLASIIVCEVPGMVRGSRDSVHCNGIP